MRKALRLLALVLSFTLLVSGAQAAVKAGATCSKLGSTSTVSGKKYTCIKSGKKLVWNKGVVVVKPTTVPTPAPTATPAPTHKSGIVANGTAALKYIGSRVTGTPIVSSGVITGVTLNGSIYDITMATSGSGYTSAPAVTLIGGGGSGFVGSSIMSGTSVQRVYITNSGINFTSVPTVRFGTLFTN